MNKIRLFASLVLFATIFAGIGSGPVLAEELAFKANMSGLNENPPRVTNAQGEFEAELSEDGTELSYKLEMEEISNVTAAHIHVGGATVNGPVVAFLYGNVAPGSGFSKKIVVSGVITADDLVGPLAGQPLSALVDQMVLGNTYANAHTNDGVAPVNTGAGDFPGGEIRGQIFLK
jgi:CHRD domain